MTLVPKKLTRLEFYVFLGILGMLLVKFLLIADLTFDSTHFLNTYRFVFNDSYDWIANGIRLFNNDGISYRNPGLVLIIKLLYSVHLLFLLPLLGNLAFFVMLVFLYKLCRLVASQSVSLILIVLVALNFSLNAGADVILADIYAVAFMTVSFYYLATKKYLVAFFMLALSILFQNIGYFLIPIWAAYFAFNNWPQIKAHIKRRDYRLIIKSGLMVGLSLSPALLWNLYKFIKFGDPLYTRVAQLELLHPNLNSIDFYFVNFLSMFGYAVIALAIFMVIKYRQLLTNKLLVMCLGGVVFNFIFWVILYDWDERRFLLYFIPFLYPIMAYFLQFLFKQKRWLFIVMLLAFYPTLLPLNSFLASDELPIVQDVYLRVITSPKQRKVTAYIQRRQRYDNPLINLNPVLYSAIINYDKNHTTNGSTYAYYTRYIDLNYDVQHNKICIDRSIDTKTYLIRSIIMINRGIDLTKVTLHDNCHAKT